MTHVITQPCCNDATCIAVCPVACIHPTPEEPGYATAEMLYIDPDTCIDCGACVDVCPVEAILPDSDLTPDNRVYLELNATHYEGRSYPTVPPPATSVASAAQDVLRVAVIGSGPAAMYTADELLSRRDLPVEVHVFEKLPAPWGLVRYGVAPDHPGTKEVAKLFKKTASKKGFTFHLNTEVGEHLTHDELLQHVHAVVYAVGAPHDRTLDVPGEDLPGCASATDFVAWYNGHPAAAHRTFDLSHERAVVIGNGNVALDVARVLLSDPDDLARTDIADHALAALRDSRVREVVVVGRRGVGQAAFTTPELLGLRGSRAFDVVAEASETAVDEATLAHWRDAPDPIAVMKARLLTDLDSHTEHRAFRLRFGWSPVQVLGTDRVIGIRLRRNDLSYDGSAVRVVPTDETVDLDCGLVLRAVGYHGAPVRDLPFDAVTGTLPHDRGRVVSAGGEPLPGVYATGWVKRGPSGVIGTNKWDAAETVRSLLEDRDALPAPTGTTEDLMALLAERQPARVDGKGWQALDAHERFLAKGTGRPRIKVVDVEAMLDVVKQARS